MDKKVMGIIAVVAIIVIALVALFAFSGDGSSPANILSNNSSGGGILSSGDSAPEPVKNKTFEFEACTLELPEDSAILNLSNNEDGFSAMMYMVVSNSTNDSFVMAVASGENLIPSADSYVDNMIAQGNNVEKVEDYGKWVIVKNNDVSTNKYSAVNVEGGYGFIISHDNTTALKNIVDTFKLKE